MLSKLFIQQFLTNIYKSSFALHTILNFIQTFNYFKALTRIPFNQMATTARRQREKKQQPANELSSNFTFWLQDLQNVKLQSYGSALKQLATVTNLKQFWEIFQFFKKTNDLPPSSDIYMFKQGIKPEWQDKQNIGGGCFKIKIEKVKSNKLWENSIFALVSPNNKFVNLINGIRIKIREKFDQVEIWLPGQTSDKEKLEQVKGYFKQNLQLSEDRIFNFYGFSTGK